MAPPPSTPPTPWGALTCGVLAGILTATDLVVLARYDIDPVWAWLQVPVLVLAWCSPVAWLRRRWLVAGLGLLAMLGGLWGYFYLPPIAALVLAVVSLMRAARRAPGSQSHAPAGSPAPGPRSHRSL